MAEKELKKGLSLQMGCTTDGYLLNGSSSTRVLWASSQRRVGCRIESEGSDPEPEVDEEAKRAQKKDANGDKHSANRA